MSNIIEITDFNAPELDIYARLSEGQLQPEGSGAGVCDYGICQSVKTV